MNGPRNGASPVRLMEYHMRINEEFTLHKARHMNCDILLTK